MKIYFANVLALKDWSYYLRYKINVLGSYPEFKSGYVHKPDFCSNLFLDSGAFGKERDKIKIDDYINLIYNNKSNIDIYANLDSIGNAEKSYKNLMEMENQGLYPLPVFHAGSDIKWLDKLLSDYDYIALGGMVSMAKNKNWMKVWLDKIWKYIYHNGSDVKVHGFGIQSFDLMKRYPWYSVDASSVYVVARYGGIYTPFGTCKINPKVNSKEMEWQIRKPGFTKFIEEFVSKYTDYSYKEAQDQTVKGTLIRSSISMHYMIDEFKNHKCQYQFLNNKTLF